MIESQSQRPTLLDLGLEYRDGEYWPGKWRLEIRRPPNPRAYLYVPFLTDPIVLEMDEFDDARAVHRAVLRGARIALDDEPGKWRRIWKGSRAIRKRPAIRGLEFKLLDVATLFETPEMQREQLTAQVVLRFLSVATDDPEQFRGPLPWREADGLTWFSFAVLYERVQARRITRNELSAVLAKSDVYRHMLSIKGKRQPFLVITPRGLELLRSMSIPGVQR